MRRQTVDFLYFLQKLLTNYGANVFSIMKRKITYQATGFLTRPPSPSEVINDKTCDKRLSLPKQLKYLPLGFWMCPSRLDVVYQRVISVVCLNLNALIVIHNVFQNYSSAIHYLIVRHFELI